MNAGRELDALVAEKVFGIDLAVPRTRALAVVGATYVEETSHAFTLRTGDVVGIPDDLPVLPGDVSGNERYFRHIGQWLMDECDDEGVRADVTHSVETLRDIPEPYSTDIAAAWTVVEKLGGAIFAFGISQISQGKMFCATVTDCKTGKHVSVGSADTAPHAICLAAIRTRGGPRSQG